MTGPDTTRDQLAVDPAALAASADRMDALADRLRTALAAVERAGNPVPAGGDEVSVWAAGTLGRESDDLLAVVTDTAERMGADASGLRGYAASYERTEDANAEIMSGVRLP